ncbi:hypothetical protein RC55_16635 [Herbaspirillum seropedicae]|nr:hypothetical protein [Herbaspirillum seropedicae]
MGGVGFGGGLGVGGVDAGGAGKGGASAMVTSFITLTGSGAGAGGCAFGQASSAMAHSTASARPMASGQRSALPAGTAGGGSDRKEDDGPDSGKVRE